MAVTVDDQPLPTEELGLDTVGQVLTHLQRGDRLIVHLLIDGQEPDLTKLSTLKQSPIRGHTLYIETTEPRRLAMEALSAVERQLAEGDKLTTEAVDLLRSGDTAKAMERLQGCFRAWQMAQETIVKLAELLRIDLGRIYADGRPFSDVLNEFGEQLRLIKKALENRDYVCLIDTLVYEISEMSGQWTAAIRSIRSIVK